MIPTQKLRGGAGRNFKYAFQRHSGGDMQIRFKQLNPHSCKAYLLGDMGSNEVILIDPVLDHINDYLKYLDENKLKLSTVIDTHTHADHISGCASLMDETGCIYMMYEGAPAKCPQKRLQDGSKFNIGAIPAEVMHTPGHTKDGIVLILPDRIFTGDTLFLDDGGAGRDDLPGGDPGEHWESLQRIMRLPEHLIVYPAHEYRHREPSSLARQKKTNPHLKFSSKSEFIKYITDLKLGPAAWMNDVLKANYACAQDPNAAWIPVDMPSCETQGTLGHNVNDQPVEFINPEKLKNIFDSGTKPLLLDVREKKELAGELGHLPSVFHKPIDKLASSINELTEFKNKEIVTVCRSGGRATTAAQILKQAGFKKVFVLEGGMVAWRKKYGNK